MTGLSAGGVHTCVLRSTGAAQCWGSNTYGSSGDNTVASKTTVTQVSGMGGNAGMPAVINVTASNGSSASTSVTLSVS